MVTVMVSLLGLLHFLKTTEMAIGIQRFLIDVVTLPDHEAPLLCLRTFPYLRIAKTSTCSVGHQSSTYYTHSLRIQTSLLTDSYLPSRQPYTYLGQRPASQTTSRLFLTPISSCIIFTSLRLFDICFLLAKAAQLVCRTT